jgi:hypothetical protein
MMKLRREDLWPLETYAERRPEFREQVMQHKKLRQIALGDHARLIFEDETTVRYQVQEMLRIEKVFEADGIQDELDAYNPLIPDGSNWKATFMLEYPDPEHRKTMLQRLIGVERCVWVQVDGNAKVYPIADEDLERENADKTSSVHFLRFELNPSMVAAVKHGADIFIGIDHQHYIFTGIRIGKESRDSLAADLKEVKLN